MSRPIWEENANEMIAAAQENQARVRRQMEEYYAGKKISSALQKYTAQKAMRNRAARPPGTLANAPGYVWNNTGGELYKLYASKAANRWPRTRKGRKNRKARKSRRRN